MWLPAAVQTVLDLLHFPYYDARTLILAQAWILGYVLDVFWCVTYFKKIKPQNQ